MTFAVKEGVALPPPDKSMGGIKPMYPFRSMEVGQIFFVPGKSAGKFSTYVCLQARKLGRKFSSQTIYMRQDLETDEWEPCKAGAVGSQKGCAVRRIS